MSTPTSTPRSSVVVPGITPLPGYVPTTPITTPRRTPASTRSDRLQRVTFGIRRRRSLGSGSNFASQSFASFTGTDPVRDADEPQLVSQPADVATALEESVFGRSQQHDETPRDPKRMRSTRSFFGAHSDKFCGFVFATFSHKDSAPMFCFLFFLGLARLCVLELCLPRFLYAGVRCAIWAGFGFRTS